MKKYNTAAGTGTLCLKPISKRQWWTKIMEHQEYNRL